MYIACLNKDRPCLFNINNGFFINEDGIKEFIPISEYKNITVLQYCIFDRYIEFRKIVKDINFFAISQDIPNYTNSPLVVTGYSFNNSSDLSFSKFQKDKVTLIDNLFYQLRTEDGRREATIQYEKLKFKSIR